MRIKKLGLKNFRGFEELTIDFPEGESGLAVFVGVNGSGKTSVLEAIVHLLNDYCLKLTKPYRDKAELSNISQLKPRDVKTGCEEAECALHIKMRDFDVKVEIDVQATSKSAKTKNGEYFDSQEKIISEIRNRLDKIQWYAAPIIAYYPAGRMVKEPELKVIDVQSIQPWKVYHNSLDLTIDFDSFFDWFRSMEDNENERRLNEDNSYRDPSLNSVRTAITNFIGNIKNPRVKRQPVEELIIEKGSQQLSFQSLSSGERAIIALVGDIARRLSNVFWTNPLNGDGIVLIDEIEQHLHPGWQRTIIPNLRRTFPNIQFILTTHSPQVLSTLKKENVFILSDFKLVKDTPHTFGRDSNAILWDIFGVEKRPAESKEEFSKLYRLMDDPEKIKETELLLRDVEEKYGYYDEEVVRARGQFEFLNED